MASKIDAEALAAAMEAKKQAHIAAKKAAAEAKELRQKIITERIGTIAETDGLDEAKLRDLMGVYYNRVRDLDSFNYDMERKVHTDGDEIGELKKKVMDLRGKFIVPSLKKVTHDFDEL